MQTTTRTSDARPSRTTALRRGAARLGAAAALSAGALTLAPAVAQASTAATQGAVDVALAQVGDPYVYGAAGPDTFDCSGLVQYSFGQVGVASPRTTGDLQGWGTPVATDALQPGDLVFSYGGGHVGMYVGDGSWVDAPDVGQTVEVTPVPWASVTSAVRPPV
ncbi:C40 family peptidase [Rhodococcus aerolatus]